MSPRSRTARKKQETPKDVTPPVTTDDDGLDALTDDELAAKVAAKYPDYDSETIAKAITERRDEVIADLRKATVDSDDATTNDTPEPDVRPIAEAPTADMEAEFPTPWHREAYLAGLEREIEGAKRRVEELTEFGVTEDVLAEATAMVENAEAELKRVKKAT